MEEQQLVLDNFEKKIFFKFVYIYEDLYIFFNIPFFYNFSFPGLYLSAKL